MKKMLFFLLLSLIKLSSYAQMAVDANMPHRDNWGQWAILYKDNDCAIYSRTKLCGFVDKVRRCSLHESEIEFKLTGSAKTMTATAVLDAEKPKCNGTQEFDKVKYTDKLVFTETKPAVSISHTFIKMKNLQLKDVKK